MPRKNATASSRDFTLRVTGSCFGLTIFVHLRLDRRQILGRERALVGEVVVEAVVDHRADRDLRVREQPLHRLRQQVRGGVAQDLQRLRSLSVTIASVAS